MEPNLQQPQENSTPAQPQSTPVARSAITPRDIMNFFLAAFFVSLIVFGAFLSYIVFNPEQARFFINFGINPRDIASLLERLVNTVFSVLTLVFSVIWIIFLFRVFLTEKKYIRRRTLALIGAVAFGILLFGGITTWAYLLQKINASDYENPNGGVIVSDNDLLLSTNGKQWAQLEAFDNIIGPITLRYDIASNAKYVGRNMNITRFTLDFNGDGKSDNTIDTNPTSAEGILYTFNQKGTFTPKLTYYGTDKVTNEQVQKEIDLPSVNIAEVIVVDSAPRLGGGMQMTYDANSLKELGNIEWFLERHTGDLTATGYAANPGLEDIFLWEAKFKDYAFSHIFNQQELLCMRITYEWRNQSGCDRVFVVRPDSSLGSDIQIVATQDVADPLTIKLSYTGSKTSQIGTQAWIVDSLKVSSEPTTEFTFVWYGKHVVTLEIKGLGKTGQLQRIEKEVVLAKPLALLKTTDGKTMMQILDEQEQNLVDSIAPNDDIFFIDVPQTFTFDAKFVRAQDKNYDLKSVAWDFDGAGTFAKTEKRITHNFFEEQKYTVVAKYIFKNVLTKEEQEVREVFIFDGRKQDIVPRLELTQDSPYAPSRVRFDGSASQVRNGEIMEYLFDFGDKKWEIKGDAVQSYLYNAPGEYTVTFTVVKTDGKKESISKKVIVKVKSQQKMSIVPSLATSEAGGEVSFESDFEGSDAESYTWNFGDGSTSSEKIPSHVFKKEGKYTVSLEIVLKDGRIRDASLEFEVTPKAEED